MNRSSGALVFTFQAKADQSIKVTLSRQAELLLLDEENFYKRRRGEDYKALGGIFRTSPALIEIPGPGKWHLIIEDHEKAEATASLVAA